MRPLWCCSQTRESYDKTAYSDHVPDDLRELGDCPAQAWCYTPTATPGYGAGDSAKHARTNAGCTNAQRNGCPCYPEHDAADEPEWAADTDYHQGGRGGNTERSSAAKQRRDSDTDHGSPDSDAADSCAGQWSAGESREAFSSSPAMRDRVGRDGGE